jgi:hypothetical protein
MNPRERLLAISVVGVIILGGLGLMFHQLFLSPYYNRMASLELLQKQGQTKETRVAEIAAQRSQLERYRQQSLPTDVDMAKREYVRYLNELLQKSSFRDASVSSLNPDARNTPALSNKTPIYTKLGFRVSGRASLESLVKMLEGFYRTGLLHQIKTLAVNRPLTFQQGQRRDELDINLTIEALAVTGAEKRPTLMPVLDRRLAALDTITALRGGPAGLGAALWMAGPFGPVGPGNLAEPARDYSAIAYKNVFFGPTQDTASTKPAEPQLELLKQVYLTTVSTDFARNGRREAMLWDRYNNLSPHLRTSPGFNQFALLQNSQGATLIHGEVVRIDERGLIFRVGLNARDPEEKGPNYYKDREEIYHLHKDQADELARSGAIRTDDGVRVFWVDKGRWDALQAEKMVSVTGRNFVFRWELVRGHVLREDSHGVILRVDDKYCSYRYDSGDKAPRPHEGYCTLHVGHNLAEALRNPLPESEIKQLAAQK